MNCTAFGLMVAIIGLIGYAVLNGKTQQLEDDINEASVQVLNLVVATGIKAVLNFSPGTLHFPDDVATNLLTINATDPRSGTAEFKACAVRIERVASALAAAGDD